MVFKGQCLISSCFSFGVAYRDPKLKIKVRGRSYTEFPP